jgi:hypothetical protein
MEEENSKTNVLGFQEMASIFSPLGLYGGNRQTKLPLRPNTRIHAPRGTLGIFIVEPSDGCPATAPCIASTQDMRSRCVSSTSKSSNCIIAHRSDRCPPPVKPVPTGQTHWSNWSDVAASGLRPWLCGSTKEPSCFLVNHWKPRELSVASTNHHSWIGSHIVPARSWLCGSTKAPSTTLSSSSGHHAACTWPRWPPSPSSWACLSSPHLEAYPATTFCACSSPAPTPVKPQPAPAILSQESVHTTLSITHHTRKRPSTSPRTTQALTNVGLWAAGPARRVARVRRVIVGRICFIANE